MAISTLYAVKRLVCGLHNPIRSWCERLVGTLATVLAASSADTPTKKQRKPPPAVTLAISYGRLSVRHRSTTRRRTVDWGTVDTRPYQSAIVDEDPASLRRAVMLL